jgi:DNA-binding transcriptional LysR family regulator
MVDKLEFLIALARERHFGRAAEACGVAQPTFSAAIKQLEDTLGLLLVQRGARFRSFTPEGERVLEWAKRIVADAQALRQEARALQKGHLVGHLRMAVIPTALPMVASLTTPFRVCHPEVRFTIRSSTSVEVLTWLETLEIDAGITYLENEPLGRVRAIPLYRERYRLLISADHPLGRREEITWAEVARIPLCLLMPDMQNRRIIDHLLRETGYFGEAPTLESNSMILLVSHVRTGQWASIMPAILAEPLGLFDAVRAIPIVEPAASHTVGLVVARREPMAPIVAALVAEAVKVARILYREN